MVYLDNAATSFPKPAEVIRAASEALTVYGGNPGRGGTPPSSLTAEKVFAAREKIDRYFDGYGAMYTVFTSSATASLNAAVFGTVAAKKKRHLVITAFEHNSVYRPAEAVRRAGGSFTVVRPSLEDDSVTVRRVLAAVRHDTAAVCITHASNVCGRVLPVEEIGRLLSGSGVALIADASQSAGHRRLSMRQGHITVLCTAGHKGLLGPTGTGLMLLSPSFLPLPTVFGGTGSHSALPFPPPLPPERYEAGTLNTAGILGLSAGIDVLTKTPSSREAALCRRLYRGLSAIPSVKVLLPYSEINCVPVVSYRRETLSSLDEADRLGALGFATRGGLHCAPLCHRFFGTENGGTVRVSPGRFTSEADVDAFLSAVEKI